MSRRESESHIRPALLYTLLDDDPESSNDPHESLRTQTQRYKESVRRDLQDLLNTRQRCTSLPKEYAELARSVLEFGVPDVTGANLTTPDRRAEFLRKLAKAIAIHDARFKQVGVVPLENADPADRTLRFRIEATLMVEEGSEPVVFDFQLEPVSRQFK